jgi:23S rRNA (uracil1939-C5)-methyltransferase
MTVFHSLQVQIESLDHDGQGVARHEGKTIFVKGGLPGETVTCTLTRNKPSWAVAMVDDVLHAAAERVTPQCPHFGVCGGCSMQHADHRAQVAYKQRVLEDALWHIGRVRPERVLSPIYAQPWGYRHRARLSARHVRKKGGSLVGFRERQSSYVTDMDSCEVLPPRVSLLIPALRQLIDGLSICEQLPQIELAIGDPEIVLVFRVLAWPSEADQSLLRAFAEQQQVQVWLQPKGPDTAAPFWPLNPPALRYSLPEYAVQFEFRPTDFTQVNHAVNQMLVRRALGLLQPQAGERVADFFCGLGNFTLPMVRLGAQAFGYEGSAELIARARQNAQANGLATQTEFAAINLFDAKACSALPSFAGGKVLLDPPREGAVELLKSFAGREPQRIVYVSCDPATLARDVGYLCGSLGYELRAAGIANMFPHTSHVESIALLERTP